MPESHPITDLASLQAAVRRGQRLKFVHFWGHQPQPDGSIGRSCLSQWFASPFEADGITYLTAEHFMMAEKARLFGDQAALARVLAAKDPGSAKAAGRAVEAFEESVWQAHRFDIVVRANLAKFRHHADLRSYLLGTGTRVLVEASPVDPVWGIGLAETDDAAGNPLRWKGSNLLGFALMQVRDQLAADH